MEAMKRSSGYAESQIRLLLTDLRNGSQSAKEKAIKRFKEYIDTYKPNICDDDATLLFVGARQGSNRINGLMHFCGLDSEKHKNQLKRVTKDAIQLLKYLLTMDYETSEREYEDESDEEQLNIFYTIFVHLDKDIYKFLNLTKHLQHHDGKDESRGGSLQDACEIIRILLMDHRRYEGDEEQSDPLDLDELLENNGACIDVYNVWIKKAEADHINKTIENFNKAKLKAASRILRPDSWSGVIFVPVPPQEGEENAVVKSTENDEEKPIPDPLGIIDTDLRTTQNLYKDHKLTVSKGPSGFSSGNFLKRLGAKGKGGAGMMVVDSDDSDAEESDSEEDNWQTATASRTRRFSLHGREDDREDEPAGRRSSSVGDASSPNYRDRRGSQTRPRGSTASPSNMKVGRILKPVKDSILPKDKNFSAGLFLSLVHGSASFAQLSQGLRNLEKLLGVQGSQRELLVRSHYGLFIMCAKGLNDLKVERRSGAKAPANGKKGSSASVIVAMNADETLSMAEKSLNTAKMNANLTLEPILKGMKAMNRLKNTSKIVKKFESTLDLPIKMKKAWEKGDLDNFFVFFKKIMALPASGTAGVHSNSVSGLGGAHGAHSVHHSQAQALVLASGASFRLFQKVRSLADLIIANIKVQALSVLHYPCFDITSENLYDVYLKSLDFSDSESDGSDVETDEKEASASDAKGDMSSSSKAALEAIDVTNYYVSGYERLLPYYKLLIAVDAGCLPQDVKYSPVVPVIIQQVFSSQCYYFVSSIKSLVFDMMDDILQAMTIGTEMNYKVAAQSKSSQANTGNDLAGEKDPKRRGNTLGKRRVSFFGDINGVNEAAFAEEESLTINPIGGLDNEDEISYEASAALFEESLDDMFLPDYYYSNSRAIWDLDVLSSQEKTFYQTKKVKVDYRSILVQRVRILYCLRFCRSLLQWLPVLHRLCSDFQVAIDRQFTQATNNLLSSALRHASNTSNASAASNNLGANILQSPTRILPQIIALVGEIVMQCIQGLQTSQMKAKTPSFASGNKNSEANNRDNIGDSQSNTKSVFDVCDLLLALSGSPAAFKDVFTNGISIPTPKPTAQNPASPHRRKEKAENGIVDEELTFMLSNELSKAPLDENNYDSLLLDVSHTYEAIEEILQTQYENGTKKTPWGAAGTGGTTGNNKPGSGNQSEGNHPNDDKKGNVDSKTATKPLASVTGTLMSILLGSKGSTTGTTTTTGVSSALSATAGANNKRGGANGADTNSSAEPVLKLHNKSRIAKGSLYYDQISVWRNISNESDVLIAKRLSHLFLEIIRYLPSLSEINSGDDVIAPAVFPGSTASAPSLISSLGLKKGKYLLDPQIFAKSRSGGSSSQKRQSQSTLGGFELVASSFYYWCLIYLQKVESSVADCSAVAQDITQTIKTSFFSLIRSLEVDFARFNNGTSSVIPAPRRNSSDIHKSRQKRSNSTSSINGANSSGGDDIDLFALDASLSTFQSSLFERCGGDPSSNSNGAPSSDSSRRGGTVATTSNNQAKASRGSATLLGLYYDLIRSVLLIRSNIVPVVSSTLLSKFPYQITGNVGDFDPTSREDQNLNGLYQSKGNRPKTGSRDAALQDDPGSFQNADGSPRSSSFFGKIFSTKKSEGAASESKETGVHSKLLSIYQADEEIWGISGMVYEDALKLEDSIFLSIIENFASNIRNVLFSSYVNSLKRLYAIDPASNTTNVQLTSAHLSQILIVVGEERFRLSKTFHNCYFTSGAADHFILLVSKFISEGAIATRTEGKGLSSEHNALEDQLDDIDLDSHRFRDDEDDDGDSQYYSIDRSGDSSGNKENGERYSDVLFKGMCYAVLELYGKLLQELRTGSFSTNLKSACAILTGGSIDASKDPAVMSLLFRQAFEELECLKTVMRQVFPTISYHVAPLENKPPPSTTSSSSGASIRQTSSTADYSKIQYLSRDDLLKIVLNLSIKILR